MDYNRLYSQGLKNSKNRYLPIGIRTKEIAYAFNGGCHDKNANDKQETNIAKRLSAGAIEALSTIVSFENSKANQ